MISREFTTPILFDTETRNSFALSLSLAFRTDCNIQSRMYYILRLCEIDTSRYVAFPRIAEIVPIRTPEGCCSIFINTVVEEQEACI